MASNNNNNETLVLTTAHYWLAVKAIPRLASHKKIALVEKYGLTTLFSTTVDLTLSGLTSRQQLAVSSPDCKRSQK